jgi:hypothetical protein
VISNAGAGGGGSLGGATGGRAGTDGSATDGSAGSGGSWIGGSASSGGSPGGGGSTGGRTAAQPSNMLDVVFMVDNSPTMDTTQQALAASVPALIDELKKRPMGLPDLHIGFVSSDLGAGGFSLPGNCSRIQGDQGRFQARLGCGLNDGALWLEFSADHTNFSGDINKVLGCLATLGTGGCGYEHQLKSLAVALQRPEQAAFFRDEAALAIVLITDEDDCSAPWRSDMFVDAQRDETTSLRCSTRGHACNGKTLEYPTTHEFQADLATCAAREDSELPLMKVSEIVAAVRESKPRPSEQIIVGGLFSWPVDWDGSPGKFSYHIGKDPTASTGQEEKWDFLPLCEPTGLGKFYTGLRMKAFVDAFGENGLVFPLCAGDLQIPMQKLGQRLAATLK